jgi:hypothetical protein
MGFIAIIFIRGSDRLNIDSPQCCRTGHVPKAPYFLSLKVEAHEVSRAIASSSNPSSLIWIRWSKWFRERKKTASVVGSSEAEEVMVISKQDLTRPHLQQGRLEDMLHLLR